MHKPLDFKSFERRVRLVRFWRGATFGLLAGSVLACVLVAIFRLHGQIAPWPYAAAVVGISCVLWAVLSAVRRIAQFDLADSLDRRAGLKNRLATALSLESDAHSIEAELQGDAVKHLQSIKPQRAFPIRFGKLQGLSIALALAAGIVTVLGNRPIVLSAAEREKRADSDEAANAVERVLQPYVEQKPVAADATQKAEVAEMQNLVRDLRESKVDREQALQKANQAVEDAKKLEAKTADAAKAKLQAAETAMQGMEKKAEQDAIPMDPAAELASEENARAMELQKQIDATKKELESAQGKQADALKSKLNSLKNSLDSAKEAAKEAESAMAGKKPQGDGDDRQIPDLLQHDSPPNAGGSPDPLAEFKRLRKSLMAAVQAEIANIKERLKTATGAEAERLRNKLAELEAEYAEAKKEVEVANKALAAALKAHKLAASKPQKPGPSSPEMHTKFNKPMRSALAKMKQALHKIEAGDDLSEEESKELNTLADQMDVEAGKAASSGDKERGMTATLLAQVARDLAKGSASIFMACSCADALSGMNTHGNSHQAGPGSYMPTSSENNSGQVNHLDKGAKGQGKTSPTMVDTLKGDGPSSYIEVRGPASLGARSAIPYRTVLPSYQRKEEAALNRGKIPKKHLKRVRAYFDSLNGH